MSDLDIIKLWLEEKHCQLWQNFDISDDEGRTKAATWLKETMLSVVKFHEARQA